MSMITPEPEPAKLSERITSPGERMASFKESMTMLTDLFDTSQLQFVKIIADKETPKAERNDALGKLYETLPPQYAGLSLNQLILALSINNEETSQEKRNDALNVYVDNMQTVARYDLDQLQASIAA